MENAETLEAAQAPLSPKLLLSSDSKLSDSNPRTNPSAFPFIDEQPSDNTNNNNNLTDCFPLETVHEKSHHNDNNNYLSDNNNDDDYINASSYLDKSNLSTISRKRKFFTTDRFGGGNNNKRKRDKSFSETKKKRVSGFFKTPINYFSNRRRTIDTSSCINQSLNQSNSSIVASTSGVFNVETITTNDNHDDDNDNNDENININTPKKCKKNLFTANTFSMTRFNRSKSRKKFDLNATRLSFGGGDVSCGDINGIEKLNASCFPNISLNPLNNNSELRNEYTKDIHGPSVPTVAVLTSFHSTLY